MNDYAYEHGRNAAQAGMSRHQNPYMHNTEAYADWDKGFMFITLYWN